MRSLDSTWKACLAGAGLCWLTACGPAGDNGDDAANAMAAGEQLFQEQCSACHGPAGRGPSLETLQALSPEALRDGIRNHPKAGEIPQRLPATQLQDLVNFLEE